MRSKKLHGTEFTAHQHLKATPMRNQTNQPLISNNLKLYLWLWGFFMFCAVAGLARMKDDVLDLQTARYCKMVHLGKTSGDEAVGWPDFEKRYDTDCNSNGTVKGN